MSSDSAGSCYLAQSTAHMRTVMLCEVLSWRSLCKGVSRGHRLMDHISTTDTFVENLREGGLLFAQHLLACISIHALNIFVNSCAHVSIVLVSLSLWRLDTSERSFHDWIDWILDARAISGTCLLAFGRVTFVRHLNESAFELFVKYGLVHRVKSFDHFILSDFVKNWQLAPLDLNEYNF